MAEKVSIIVPVYNVESYINKCVDSILKQTYENIEIILVDDGSMDLSGNICDEYLKKDNRVKVIHKKNGGLSSARNKGIENATGEFYMFIDSDDYIEENMVERMYFSLINNKCDICVCEYFTDGLNSVDIEVDLKEDRVLDTIGAMNELIEGNIKGFACNKIYKKDLFLDIKFPEGKVYEDIYVMHLLFNKCNCICCITDKLYHYIQREDSITHIWSIKSALDYYYAIKTRILDVNAFKKYNMYPLYAELLRTVLYLNITWVKVDRKEKYKFKDEVKCVEKDFNLYQEVYNRNTQRYLTNNEIIKSRILKLSKSLYRIFIKVFYDGYGRKIIDNVIGMYKTLFCKNKKCVNNI